MSSDRDRQREKLITLLRAQFPHATKDDVVYAADDLVANVETVIRAAGGTARMEYVIEDYNGEWVQCSPSDADAVQMVFTVRKVATDEQR